MGDGVRRWLDALLVPKYSILEERYQHPLVLIFAAITTIILWPLASEYQVESR